jgi:ribonuclease HI
MTIRINSDASFRYSDKKAGIAIIVRYDNKIIFKQSYNTYCQNSMEAELLAINRAFTFLINKFNNNKLENNQHIIIFTDCKELISKIYKPNIQYIKSNKSLICQCRQYKNILSLNNKINVEWIPRKNNKLADKLSRIGI